MLELDQETVARANDACIERYMECVQEIANGGYNALIVSEMNAIHKACYILVQLHHTLGQML